MCTVRYTNTMNIGRRSCVSWTTEAVFPIVTVDAIYFIK